MARGGNIHLGSFTISSYLQKDFVLVVTASANLFFSEGCPDVRTAAELGEKVRAGCLWITRGSSCSFELRVAFEDLIRKHQQENLDHVVITAFEALPAWASLGLDLRRKFDRFHGFQRTGMPYSYSIQHIHRNSALVTLEHVPCAHLSMLYCQLSFESSKRATQVTPMKSNARLKNRRIVTLHIPPRKLKKIAEAKNEDRFGMNNRGKPLKFGLRVTQARLARSTANESGRRNPTSQVDVKEIDDFTRVALNLLLGLRQKYSGVRIQNMTKFTTLLELAPAVWDAHYFQNVMSRAQLVPIISSALSNLTTTTWPELRQRLQGQALDIVEESRRHILALILRHARRPTTKSWASTNNGTPIDVVEIPNHTDEELEVDLPRSTHWSAETSTSYDVSLQAHVDDLAFLSPHSEEDASLSCNAGLANGRPILSNHRRHTDGDELLLLRARPSSLLASPGVLRRSGTTSMLQADHSYDAGHQVVDANSRIIEEQSQQYVFDPSFGSEYTNRTSSNECIDEDYLEAEQELVKFLHKEEIPSRYPCSEDDYSDEVYLETEQQLSQLMASQDRIEPGLYEHTTDDLIAAFM